MRETSTTRIERSLPRRPIAPVLLALAAAGLLAACGGGEGTRATLTDSARLAIADTIFQELGGELTADLSPADRWRLIGSVGVGLPPPGFRREQLPEPESRAAGLLEAYCTQCHGLPTPVMHSAAEWPTLMRRMEARSRMLRHRMEGPHLQGALGERLLQGMTSSFVPPPADRDTLLRYLRSHALPVVDEGEIPDTEAGRLFVRHCAICHEAPDPDAHTPAEWEEEVVPRMQANMGSSGLPTLTDAEQRTIVGFLRREASD